jgi:RimJ/RimL family protein N-acetyltransferase
MGDYWFSYVYKAEAAERMRAAEQERLGAKMRRVSRERRRLQRPQLHLAPAGLADLADLASCIPSREATLEWVGSDIGWPLNSDELAQILHKDDGSQHSAWTAWSSNRPIGFATLDFHHNGHVAQLNHVLVRPHWRAATTATTVVRQVTSRAFANPDTEVVWLRVYAQDKLRCDAYQQAGFRSAIRNTTAVRVGEAMWDQVEMFLERQGAGAQP